MLPAARSQHPDVSPSRNLLPAPRTPLVARPSTCQRLVTSTRVAQDLGGSLLKTSTPQWDTAEDRAKSSRRKSLKSHINWDTAQERAKSSCRKSLKSHMMRVKVSRLKTSVGHCSRAHQVLAPQEPQEPPDARQDLASQDLSGILLKTRQVLAPQRLSGTLLKTLTRAKPQWETVQDLDVRQVLAPQDLSGILLKTRQILALQERQEPYNARQDLAPQDLSGRLLKTAPNPRAARASRATCRASSSRTQALLAMHEPPQFLFLSVVSTCRQPTPQDSNNSSRVSREPTKNLGGQDETASLRRWLPLLHPGFGIYLPELSHRQKQGKMKRRIGPSSENLCVL
ncbi:hypothetical protein DFH08DRAFT_819206 [Mycena albidolilacea]|uniref:Uncharacterized protein n=1 Tax=Mycena albidolilacea TaxID=1033008 RepID=A0AAD6ZEX1_9AGAR|nr:hypothetical protein DFH08DRAFT_819206 [Mycena albidolilacea]